MAGARARKRPNSRASRPPRSRGFKVLRTAHRIVKPSIAPRRRSRQDHDREARTPDPRRLSVGSRTKLTFSCVSRYLEPSRLRRGPVLPLVSRPWLPAGKAAPKSRADFRRRLDAEHDDSVVFLARCVRSFSHRRGQCNSARTLPGTPAAVKQLTLSRLARYWGFVGLMALSLSSGCFPFIVPPARVSLGAGARLGAAPSWAPHSTRDFVALRAGLHRPEHRAGAAEVNRHEFPTLSLDGAIVYAK